MAEFPRMPTQRKTRPPEIRAVFTDELDVQVNDVIDRMARAGMKVSRGMLAEKGIELAVRYYNGCAALMEKGTL